MQGGARREVRVPLPPMVPTIMARGTAAAAAAGAAVPLLPLLSLVFALTPAAAAAGAATWTPGDTVYLPRPLPRTAGITDDEHRLLAYHHETPLYLGVGLHGVGLFTWRDFNPGELVLNFSYDGYRTEMIREAALEALPPHARVPILMRWYSSNGKIIMPGAGGTYLQWRDAGPWVHYINHAAEPNVYYHDGQYVAVQPIAAGSELFLDYKIYNLEHYERHIASYEAQPPTWWSALFSVDVLAAVVVVQTVVIAVLCLGPKLKGDGSRHKAGPKKKNK